MFRIFHRRSDVSPGTPGLPAGRVSVRPYEAQYTEPGAEATVHLTVAGRDAGLRALNQEGLLDIRLEFRIATQIDRDGMPVFAVPWTRLAGAVDLRPGDILWLKLTAANRYERVLHDVPLAMGDQPFLGRAAGLIVREPDGHTWSVRSAAAGMRLAHVNPGDAVALHCLVRVPAVVAPGQAPVFSPCPEALRHWPLLEWRHVHREARRELRRRRRLARRAGSAPAPQPEAPVTGPDDADGHLVVLPAYRVTAGGYDIWNPASVLHVPDPSTVDVVETIRQHVLRTVRTADGSLPAIEMQDPETGAWVTI